MEFNLAVVNEAVSAAVPDREAIVWQDRRISYGQLNDRTRRLANHLLGEGFTVHAERSELDGWESGQDHLALYLHNGNEYLEGMLGAYKARVAPFNVNYRYVEEELLYLLHDSRAKGIVYHSAFAPTLDGVRASLPTLTTLLQVADDSGHGLLDGAQWYEEALAAASPEPPPVEPSPDDLYILYTGGTTGMPKGVLWRQADIYPAALGGRDLATGLEWTDLDAIVDNARNGGARLMPAPPFMHGAAHWMAFNALGGGNTLVLPDHPQSLDPTDVWSTVEAEKVNILLIVGDAFGRPLTDELAARDYDLSSMLMIVSGGAALSSTVRRAASSSSCPASGSWTASAPRRPGRRRPRSPAPGPPPPRARSPLVPVCASSPRTSTAARARQRRAGLAGPGGPRAARLPRRRHQDGQDLPGDRRGALRRPRRSRQGAARRAPSS